MIQAPSGYYLGYHVGRAKWGRLRGVFHLVTEAAANDPAPTATARTLCGQRALIYPKTSQAPDTAALCPVCWGGRKT